MRLVSFFDTTFQIPITVINIFETDTKFISITCIQVSSSGRRQIITGSLHCKNEDNHRQERMLNRSPTMEILGEAEIQGSAARDSSLTTAYVIEPKETVDVSMDQISSTVATNVDSARRGYIESSVSMEVQIDTNVAEEKRMQKKKNRSMRSCCLRLGFLHVVENHTLFIGVYLFVFTDFIIRTFPVIAIIAIINGNKGRFFASIASILLFGVLGIYEYFANKWIQLDKTKNIVLIFMVSVLSSFYSLMSSLNILNNNEYLVKCVDSKKFILTQLLRLGFSIILYVIVFVLNFLESTQIKKEGLFNILMALYPFSSIVNVVYIIVSLYKM